MPHREPPDAQIRLDLLRKSQESQRVRDRAAVAADPPGELLLSPAELSEQLLVGLGLFDRIQILAEQILDEGELETLGVGRVTNDRGNAFESGLSGGAPAALAGDELVASASPPDDHRLDDSRHPDRRRKLVQCLRIKRFPWLRRACLDLVDRDLDENVVCRRSRRKQSAEAATEPWFIHASAPPQRVRDMQPTRSISGHGASRASRSWVPR